MDLAQVIPVWAENRVEREHKGPRACSTGLYMVRQELFVPFSGKLQVRQTWNEI